MPKLSIDIVFCSVLKFPIDHLLILRLVFVFPFVLITQNYTVKLLTLHVLPLVQ